VPLGTTKPSVSTATLDEPDGTAGSGSEDVTGSDGGTRRPGPQIGDDDCDSASKIVDGSCASIGAKDVVERGRRIDGATSSVVASTGANISLEL
jgi:hypothetical protein